jgi:hypothetical protein
MQKLLSTNQYSMYSAGAFTQFNSSVMPTLERRVNFEFGSLNSGDVINKFSFNGRHLDPFSFLPDKSELEFVGTLKNAWLHPVMDGLFFIVKDRAGDIIVPFKDEQVENNPAFPFRFLTLFTSPGSSYLSTPGIHKTVSPIGNLQGMNVVSNVNEQRLAMQGLDELTAAQRGALIAATNKRYGKDVALDMMTAHAIEHDMKYSQIDVSRITGITGRQLRSTYSDKWQVIKHIASTATSTQLHDDVMQPSM